MDESVAWLGVQLMIEMGRRVQPDREFWRPETGQLAMAAAQDSGYCIDATDDIPTGRVVWLQIDADLGCPDVETVKREGVEQ